MKYRHVEKLKYGFFMVYKHPAFIITYNHFSLTDSDRKGLVPEKQNCNLCCIFAIKVWPNAIKKEHFPLSQKGITYDVDKDLFETIIECKDWAIAQWDDRKDKTWYKEWNDDLHKYLRSKYTKGVDYF